MEIVFITFLLIFLAYVVLPMLINYTYYTEFDYQDVVHAIYRNLPDYISTTPTQEVGNDIITYCFNLPKKRWFSVKKYNEFINYEANHALVHFKKQLPGWDPTRLPITVGLINVSQTMHKKEPGSVVIVQISYTVPETTVYTPVIPTLPDGYIKVWTSSDISQEIEELREKIRNQIKEVPAIKVRSIVITKGNKR